MESIGAFEAKTRLSELLDRAAQGESFVITKHGRPVARIVPEGPHDVVRLADTVKRLKSFRGLLKGVTIDEIVEARNKGRRF